MCSGPCRWEVHVCFGELRERAGRRGRVGVWQPRRAPLPYITPSSQLALGFSHQQDLEGFVSPHGKLRSMSSLSCYAYFHILAMAFSIKVLTSEQDKPFRQRIITFLLITRGSFLLMVQFLQHTDEQGRVQGWDALGA